MNDETMKNALIGVLVKIAEGNPGAIRVLIDMQKEKEFGFEAALHLDDMNIKGWKIWVGFKDYCKQDLDKFYDLVMKRDKDMIKFINDYPE